MVSTSRHHATRLTIRGAATVNDAGAESTPCPTALKTRVGWEYSPDPHAEQSEAEWPDLIPSPRRIPARLAQILGEEKQHVYRSVLVLCIAG